MGLCPHVIYAFFAHMVEKMGIGISKSKNTFVTQLSATRNLLKNFSKNL